MDEEFIRLFNIYSNDLYRFIYSLTLNKVESNDILQETFLKLYKNMNKLPKDDLQIKKWLIRVASNQSKDFLKSYWNTRVKASDDLDISLSESEKTIYNIMPKINYKGRVVLYLYYYEGYDISEIACILNLSESAIKHRLSRTREKIRKEIKL